MEFWSAIQIARAIRERRITSLQCVDFFIDRISRLDGNLNAVVVKLFSQARKQAQRCITQLCNNSVRSHHTYIACKGRTRRWRLEKRCHLCMAVCPFVSEHADCHPPFAFFFVFLF